MKNLLTALVLSLGLGFANAQSAHPATSNQPAPKKTTTEVKKVETKKDGKIIESKTTTKNTSVKMKKDGTPDKRYKNSQHLKKDGTPDKRYKENK